MLWLAQNSLHCLVLNFQKEDFQYIFLLDYLTLGSWLKFCYVLKCFVNDKRNLTLVLEENTQSKSSATNSGVGLSFQSW